MDKECPCGSDVGFSKCCEPFLKNEAMPQTAELLMRSRFTAFCEGAVDYLVETHPRANPANERTYIQESIAQTEWVNLLVLRSSGGGVDDAEGTVEFVAAYRRRRLNVQLDAGPVKIEQMHEKSRFIRENGRWIYADGEQLPMYRTPRGAPCWCGSGRKTKQCHA